MAEIALATSRLGAAVRTWRSCFLAVRSPMRCVPSSSASAWEATFGIRSGILSVNGFADDCWGAAPHAFVVLKQDARADERELREFARANFAHFKAPHSVIFVKELPKTATGRIQKYVLRAQRLAIAP